MAVALLVLVVVLVACTTSNEAGTTTEETAGVTSVEPTPSTSPSAEPSDPEPSESEEGEADEERVTIGTSQFEPATLSIAVGTEVVFENEATFDHTVTEGTGGQAVDDPIVDEVVGPGDEVRVVFESAGTFDITCIIHPTMQMTITVED